MAAIEKKRLACVARVAKEGIERAGREWIDTFDAVADPISLLNPDGIVLRCNKALRDFVGRPFNEIIGRPLPEILGVASDSTGTCVFRLAQKSLRRESSTMELQHRWFVVHADPILDGSGRVTGFAHVMSEITQRKQAEVALTEEKERFRVLVEGSPFGVALLSKENRYLYLNPRFVEIFGYTLDDIPTRRSWFEKAYPDPVYRNDLISSWKMDLVSSRSRQLGPQTSSVTCKDGAVKRIRAIPVVTETGDRFLFYEDITEQENLRNQFIHAQKLEAVGRLAGGVAHDFNNLLTVINGYAGLALDGLGQDDPLRAELDSIRNAGTRAAVLTRQLLTFSRKQVIAPTILNLNEVIGNIEKMLRRLIGEDVELVTVMADGLGPVKADPGQIEQIVMNLAVNARDAMPEGGTFTIETRDIDIDRDYAKHHMDVGPGRYVLLTVSDTGVGMDQEIKSHIFEPFFTTKEQGRGTGLGLSTAYGIVKQSNGHIWVYSEPGKGTIFRIYLPRVKESGIKEKEQPKSESLPRGNETVLVVEDDEALRNMAERILASVGYNVFKAANGAEALLLCEKLKDPVHLLLTDVVMPVMYGTDLAERLGQVMPGIKTLYMSGYTDGAITQKVLHEEGAQFMTKPFGKSALLLKVRKVLDGD
jgi:PAS domain S-box-containing protein